MQSTDTNQPSIAVNNNQPKSVSATRRIITLTTDFGTQDAYPAIMKGVILNINPQAVVIDFSHEISPQDIRAGAFILHTGYRYFPAGSIHLVVIDPGVGSARRALIVKTKDYYFIAPDNGVLSYIYRDEAIEKVVSIENSAYFLKPTSSTFHGRDVFAPVAAYLSLSEPMDNFGPTLPADFEFVKIQIPYPEIKETEQTTKIIAHIQHIDRFGNLITDIKNDWWDKHIANKQFAILCGDFQITKLARSYSDGDKEVPIALFDSAGYLEISIKEGNANKTFNLNILDTIEIILL